MQTHLGLGLLRRLRDPRAARSGVTGRPHRSKTSHRLLSERFKHPALRQRLRLAGRRVSLGLAGVSAD